MPALVVFESMFGNTATIAAAVADGLAAHGPVRLVDVGSAPPQVGSEIELLVVGAPTHAFSLSRESTRQSAVHQGATPVTPTGSGLREWLGTVRFESRDTRVATFDTRIQRPWLPGSAARVALRRLRGMGLAALAREASFAVTGTAGPLAGGEEERARAWGRELASRLPVRR